MDREGGNEGKMRKWREIHYLHILIFSLFPPSLSMSYIENCLIMSQNVKHSTFVANVTKKTYHTGYEKIILGRIRCEKAPQVVPACTIQRQYMAWKTFVVVVPVEVLLGGRYFYFCKVFLDLLYFHF